MKKNKKIKEKIRKLNSLIYVNSIISSTLDKRQVLKDILNQTKNLMECEKSSIFLVNEKTQELYFDIVSEENEEKDMSAIRIKKGQGIAGIVWETTKSYMINNVQEDIRHNQSVDNKTQFRTRSIIATPLKINGKVIGVMEAINKNYNRKFKNFDLQIFEQLAIQASIAIQNAKLFEMATIDSKTQLYVHNFFESRLIEEVDRAIRYRRPLSLVMFDIDFFKKINDTFGHQAGDLVLFEISKIIKFNCRQSDLPGRYGGEEFVTILPETDLTGAKIFAERVRTSIEKMVLDYENKKITVTISGGIAELFDNSFKNHIELIKASDSALYDSKKNGRNKITLFTKQISKTSNKNQ
jgi:diguanylate cyclase (GGDEF)-like protein